MHYSFKLALSSLLLMLSFSSTAAEPLVIKQAWIPEMPPMSRVMAGFASFSNPSAKAIEITAVSSEQFSRIEMHLSQEVDGMARMIPQKSLVVQANSQLVLKHGSYHLMMFGPKKRFLAGDKVQLTLTLNNNQKQVFEALVKSSMGNDDHQHHHHHH